MSSLNTQLPLPSPQRHAQHVSSLTAPKVHRANPSPHRSHIRNTSITSNIAQTQQESYQSRNESDYWRSDRAFDQPVVSPGSLQQPASLFTFEETSHHESSFDDFLTTECSSDNHISEQTTPQEVIWEQQFVCQDITQPHILENYGHSGFIANRGLPESTELEAFYSESQASLPDLATGQEYLDPKFSTSTAHSLNISGETQPVGRAQGRSMAGGPTSLPQRTEASQSLQITATSTQTPSPNHGASGWQRPASKMRAPSPVVMVSSYDGTYADHGAQPYASQSSSKRIRGGEDLGDEDDADTVDGSEHGDINGNLVHLMPPGSIDTNDVRTGPMQRSGLEPTQRNDDVVLSITDLEEQRQRDERNAEVQTWLEANEAGRAPENNSFAANRRLSSSSTRRRAHTTGQVEILGRIYSDKDIPGPGVLIEVDSDDESSEEASVTSSQLDGHTKQILDSYYNSESPRLSPRALDTRNSPQETSFPMLEDEIPPELQEPLPRQFYTRTPWQDPLRGPISGTKEQPNTSNAAASKFNQEAAKWETASRAATWGTRRRLSESEIRSIVEGSQVRHLSLSKRGRDRGNSILSKARGLLPRRGSSNTKPDLSMPYPQSSPEGHAHQSSLGAIKPAQRKPSFSNKPKSPPLNTGSALIAMTGQLAAIGRSSPMAQDADTHKSSGALQALKKQRSRSDVSKHTRSSTPGLTELMTRHGGPPIPTLASPMHEREPIVAAQVIDNEDAPADDDEDDQTDEVAIRMDLEIRAEEIMPTLEGFKDHARRLNPRLEPYLIERIGQEQIRRYKNLVETKIKHTRAVQLNNKCPSGRFCFDLGGDANLLPPRASSKDPEATLTQFQVCNAGENDVDESGFTEGVVTPALFPPGVPLPPVKRLPAELECPLCFKVKKFQKPSDWTKHVHEDILPFSCTFPHCGESKSFKRKADWVRHENERHRHLEWWKCSIQECSHVCFRKDNFVQHLVREHKMKEPKVRGRASGSSKNKAVNNGGWSIGPEDDELWRLVDSCHDVTTKKPRDEPCRFCGNVCSSFKKLSVHLGKHLEQIAMPVLQLVSMREVAADTILSPLDQAPTALLMFATAPEATTYMDGNTLSPYPASATSAYQTSSAGQSPVSVPGRSQNSGYHFDRGFHTPHALTPGMQARLAGSAYGAPVSMPPQSRMFLETSDYMQPDDGGHAPGYAVSPRSAAVTPRSQPVSARYNSQMFDSTGTDYTQGAMVGIYPIMHSTPGFMPQYASPMLHDPTGHSPMGSESGLGFQTMNQNDLFGAPGNGQAGPDMQYTQ